MQVVAVERVQNSYMWGNYVQNRRHLLEVKYREAWLRGDVRMNARSPGSGAVIEQALWHGTKQLPPRDLASTAHGWCSSFADLNGRLGPGTYFAHDYRYSLKGFAYRSVLGLQIILADVLSGAHLSATLHLYACWQAQVQHDVRLELCGYFC